MGCLALAHPPGANHFPGKHLTVDVTLVPDEERRHGFLHEMVSLFRCSLPLFLINCHSSHDLVISPIDSTIRSAAARCALLPSY